MLQPVNDTAEYKRVKKVLTDRFESERTRDQDLFREQTKILQPLINTQQQTVKAIKDSQDVSSTAITNAQLPIVRDLERREQADLLMEQPFYHEELPAIAQASPDILKVNLDGNLNQTDLENLEDMNCLNKQYEATLLSLDTYNSIPNIIEGKNNEFKYYNGEAWKTIILSTGAYELNAINNEIKRQIIANGDSETAIDITADVSTLKSIVNIDNPNRSE